MKLLAFIGLFTAFSAHANPCEFDPFLRRIIHGSDPLHSDLYYQYGSSIIPSDVLQKNIAALPTVKITNFEEDILNYYRKISGRKGELKITKPDTLPTSGASVYVIEENGQNVSIAKIYGDDYRGLFKEATASDFLRRHQIPTSRVSHEATLMIHNEKKAFSFIDFASGKDINQEIKDVGQSFSNLSEEERIKFSSGSYKGAPEVPKRVKDTKREFQQLCDAAEASAKQIGKIHDIPPGSARMLEEADKRRTLLIGKIDRQLGALEQTRDVIKLSEVVKKEVADYANTKINPKLISYTHGDPHTGNFMYDHTSKKITLIDNQSLVNSFGPGAGVIGVNESTIDLALLMESLAVKARTNHFTASEIKYIQQKMLRSYLTERNLRLADVEQSLKFHRLRFDLIIAARPLNIGITAEEKAAALLELLERYQIR